MWTINPTLGHVFGENHNSKRYVYLSVHWSTVYKNQDMETTWMSIDGEWVVVYTYEGITEKNEMMPLEATQVNLEINILSELSQSE